MHPQIFKMTQSVLDLGRFKRMLDDLITPQQEFLRRVEDPDSKRAGGEPPALSVSGACGTT